MTRQAILSAAMAAAMASASHAATYNFIGANGANSNWSDATKWENLSGGEGAFPGAGDTAELKVAIDNWTSIDIQGGGSVGSIYVKPRWGPYRFKTGWSNTPTFTVDNSGATSVFMMGNHAGSNQTETNLMFGPEGNAFRLALANDLLVQNDPASVNPGKLSIASRVTIIGGSADSRRTITIQTVNARRTTMVVEGAATFVGDWVVDGNLSILDMNADSFGDASNSVTLLNGGTLDLTHAAFDSFTWTRSLFGTGNVLANANGFVLGAGSLNLFSDGTTADLLTITGDLILGPGSTLNLTGTFTGDAIPLVTATGSISGRFENVNLPGGYDLSYTDSGISLVVPEPAAVGVGVIGAVLVACRRRRQAQ